MAKWTVYEADIGREVENGAKPKYIECSPLPVSVKVDLDDDMVKEIGKDPLLQQKLQSGAADAVDKIKKECIEDLKAADKLFSKSVAEFEKGSLSTSGLEADKVEIVDLRDKMIAKSLSSLQKDCEDAVQDAYDKWKKDNKKYITFKIKIAMNIAGNTLKLAINTALIAIAGATTTIGWIMFAYSSFTALTKIWGDISKSIKEFDALAKSIEDNAKRLADDYADLIKEGAQHKLSAKEFQKGALKAIIGNIPGLDKYIDKFTKSSKSMMRDLTFCEQKLRAWEQEAHSSSKELDKILKEIPSNASEIPDELTADAKKLQGAVDNLIKSIIKLEEKVADGSKRVDKISGILKPIAEMKTNWAVCLELVFEFAKDDLPMVSSIGKLAGGIIEGVDQATDIVMTLKKANDRINDTRRLKKLAAS